MNLRRAANRDEPEINFIPLIDVLLVILIFLMVTTTYQRVAELQITLPEAEADMPCPLHPAPIVPRPALGRAAEDSRRVLLALRSCAAAPGGRAHCAVPQAPARFLVQFCASDHADLDRLLCRGI